MMDPKPVGQIAGGCLFLVALAVGAQDSEDRVAWTDIESVIAERCVMCHTGEFAPLGLRLDSLEGLLAGSDSGPVVIFGEPDASELIRRIRGDSQPRMPMTGPPFLSDEEIALFEAWVGGGMQDSANLPAVAEAESEPETASEPEFEAGEDSEPTVSALEVGVVPADDEPVTWKHVAPIFATRCAKCHTDQGLMCPAPAGYRLTSYESTTSSADRARVVPGNPDASELLRRIRGQSLPRMPFDGPPFLSEEDTALIAELIAGGAPDATGQATQTPTSAEVRLHGVLGPRLDAGWPATGRAARHPYRRQLASGRLPTGAGRG